MGRIFTPAAINDMVRTTLASNSHTKKRSESQSGKKAATSGSTSFSGIPLTHKATLGSPYMGTKQTEYDEETLTYPDGRQVTYPRKWEVPGLDEFFVLDREHLPGKWVRKSDGTVREYSDFELQDALGYVKTGGWVEIVKEKPLDDFGRLQKITAAIITGDIEAPLTPRQRMALACVKTVLADTIFNSGKWTCREVAGKAVALAEAMMKEMGE